MAAITQITSGAPPILWSNIDAAFKIINQNFTNLNLAVGGSGAVDLTNLSSDVSSSTGNNSLGSANKTWKSLYLADYINVPGSTYNGIWMGTAQITSSGGIINLPSGATIGGAPIIDATKTTFKTISVSGQVNVVANTATDTLTLVNGSGIVIATNAGAKSISITNGGVTSNVAGTGISINNSTGAVTISNTGVTSLTAGTAIGSRAAGTGISVSGSNGDITITNTGVISISQGFGIQITTNSSTGVVTVSNTAPAQVTFRNVSVAGQSIITAQSVSDTLTMAAGYGMALTTNSSNRTVTMAFVKATDITGNVYASDGTTKLVDTALGRIVGPVYANVTGNVTGALTGNADTATKLTTARNINGVAFDGTAAITLSTLVNGVYTTTLDSNGYFNLQNGADTNGALIQSTASLRLKSNTYTATLSSVNGSLTLPGALTTPSGSGITSGAGITIQNSGQLTFNNSSNVSFRVVATPVTSKGAAGDLLNDIAFDATYSYYCTTNYVAAVYPYTDLTPSNGGTSTNVIKVLKSSNPTYTQVATGWTVTIGGTTAAVTGASGNDVNPLYYDFILTVNVNIPASGTVRFTSNVLSTLPDIWKRIAWSGNTW